MYVDASDYFVSSNLLARNLIKQLAYMRKQQRKRSNFTSKYTKQVEQNLLQAMMRRNLESYLEQQIRCSFFLNIHGSIKSFQLVKHPKTQDKFMIKSKSKTI